MPDGTFPTLSSFANFTPGAAIAHFERRQIAELTKDGIAAVRAKGKHPGRRPPDADKIAAVLSLAKAGRREPSDLRRRVEPLFSTDESSDRGDPF